MEQLLKGLSRFSDNRISWITVIVFSMPVFLLTIKSWVTTSLFLLFFICFWPILKQPKKYLLNRSNQFWALLACLLIPFFAELFAQMGRGAIVGSSLDGPSRMIMATCIFVYLSRFDCSRVIQALSYGSAFGILGVGLSLVFFPDYYWGIRAATYFVDPITLPCFTVGLLGIYLFSNLRPFPLILDHLIKVFLICITAFVSVESSSRSAWVAFSCMLAIYVLYSLRRSFKAQAMGMVALMAVLVIMYFLLDAVHARINESVEGLLGFLSQSESLVETVQHTSSGQRMILGLIDIYLIKENPIFGLGDRMILPPYEEMLLVIPILTKEIYEIKVLAGSHSEILAQLVREGIIFGSLTLYALFLYPLYLFVWKYRKLTIFSGSPLAGVLGIMIPIMASSLTIQVFNLKMTISFYGLCLAIFFACLCRQVEERPGN